MKRLNLKLVNFTTIFVFIVAFVLNIQANVSGDFGLFGNQLFAQNTGSGSGSGSGNNGYEKMVTEIEIELEDKMFDGELCSRQRNRSTVTCVGVGEVECTAEEEPWSNWSDWYCPED